MKALLVALGFATLLAAHRNDEYLQAALITIERGQIGLELNLTPGQAVWPVVLAMIDADGDGQLSEIEKHSYVTRVVQSLTIEVDRVKLELVLLDSQFPEIEAMAAGQESIRLRMHAALPFSWTATHQLRFVNHHAPAIAAYLVNCLLPTNGDPVITAQKRDYAQTEIQVDYSFQTRWPQLQHTAWWIGAFGIALLCGWAYGARKKVQPTGVWR